MNGNFRKQLWLIGEKLLWSLLMLGGVQAQSQVIELDSVAAIVNDDVVTLSQIQDRYENFLVQTQGANPGELPSKDVIVGQILDRLILEAIQINEAELRGMVIDDEELTQSARSYADQVGLPMEAFRERLESEGVSFREFREELRRQMLLGRIQNAMVNRRMYITEREVQEFRSSPYFDELSSEEYRLGHILLSVDTSKGGAGIEEARAKAAKIIEELNTGSDFASMAAVYWSANTAREGGDLGWRKASQIPSLFSDVALDLEIGETAKPVENSLGIHVIQLMDKRGASTIRGQKTHLRHILVSPSAIRDEETSLALLKDLRQQILDGADFADLASEYSDDAGTALSGGDLGWTDGQEFIEEFKLTMEMTQVGEISAPFQTEFGWHILEVQDRRIEDLSEEALNSLATQTLYERRFDETLQQWLKEIRDEAFVKIIQDSI